MFVPLLALCTVAAATLHQDMADSVSLVLADTDRAMGKFVCDGWQSMYINQTSWALAREFFALVSKMDYIEEEVRKRERQQADNMARLKLQVEEHRRRTDSLIQAVRELQRWDEDEIARQRWRAFTENELPWILIGLGLLIRALFVISFISPKRAIKMNLEYVMARDGPGKTFGAGAATFKLLESGAVPSTRIQHRNATNNITQRLGDEIKNRLQPPKPQTARNRRRARHRQRIAREARAKAAKVRWEEAVFKRKQAIMESLRKEPEEREARIWGIVKPDGIKFHLLVTILCTQAFSVYEGRVPYFPIEISRTAADSVHGLLALRLGITTLLCTLQVTRALTPATLLLWIGLMFVAWCPDTTHPGLHALGLVIVVAGAVLHVYRRAVLDPTLDVRALAAPILCAGAIFAFKIVLRSAAVIALDWDSYNNNSSFVQMAANHIARSRSIMYEPQLVFAKEAYKWAIIKPVMQTCGTLQWVTFGTLSLIF